MSQLPSLGRNPLNVLNIISGCERQGHDNVNVSAVFTRGYFGKQQLDSNGNVEWIVCPNGAKPDGILNSHKATTFYRSVTNKEVVLDANGVGAVTPYLKSGSVLITSTGAVDITSDFTINLVNGVITSLSHAGETVRVSYMYDVQEPGVDETLGSGKVSIIRGVGEVTTLVYDTSVAYAVGDPLEVSNGILTKYATSGAQVAATVVKPATYADPTMRIRINL